MAGGSRGSDGTDFHVDPPDIPDEGYLFVDHESDGRSGHGGNCLVECHDGDLVSFYSNVSGEIWDGHSVAGWSEYRRSTDGGETWGDPHVLDYSKRVWDGDDAYSALVVAVAAAPDGTLVAFAAVFRTEGWVKQRSPVVLRSEDDGHSWCDPTPLDPDATVEDAALTFDAVFTHDGTLYAVFFGDDDNMGSGAFALYASEDNGHTFDRRSVLPFDPRCYYVTAGVLESGEFIVYSYDGHFTENEHDIPYVISGDRGHTWSDVRRTQFRKKIRNPQLSEKVGDRYFLHGRSGSYGDGSSNLVLYSSPDGIDWDDGILLYENGSPDDCYSANVVVGRSDPDLRDRLLIQSSINYDPDSKRVNECHWWVTDVTGT